MPTREEMRSLTEEIVGSYTDRVAGIAELRNTVKMDLKGFQDYRIATGRETRADLAKSVADRKAAVSTQLKELDATHAAMSKEMRADLANGLADCKRSTGAMLGGFSQAHSTMSKEMRADLAKGLADCQRSTGAMLEGFSQAHSTMSKEMRANLARSLADCRRSTGAMLGGFSNELKEVRSELAGGRDEWQILTATLQTQRAGLAVEVKPAEVVAALVEEITEEEVAEITPEIGGIRDRVFEYLADHPDGTRLVELEQEFGLARIQIARLLGNLIDENKVEKRDMLYFAI